MPTPSISPRFTITEDQLHGCTAWLARLLTLFSYGRCVSINKSLGHVIVSTRRFWLFRDVRVIEFGRIKNIVYRAQTVPTLLPWRYLFGGDFESGEWSFFLIGLALEDEVDEVQLFTVWQAQPRTPDWFDKLATDDADQGLGDEAARQFVEAITALTGAGLTAKPKRIRD